VTRVLYPGSFDPLHNGHLNIVEVAARLFDEVIVASVRNPQKGSALFELDERQAMIEESVAHLSNVSVTFFASLTTQLAQELGADFIVKGLRVVSDFENELIMAQMNRRLTGVDTLFIPSDPSHSYLASKLIRDVTSMVPDPVAKRLIGKYGA
jgi:pantetheine-phosphate adenylyltransferase